MEFAGKQSEEGSSNTNFFFKKKKEKKSIVKYNITLLTTPKLAQC